MEDKLRHELNEAERKAWDSLRRYKFQMFGYWAAIWVHLNRVGGFKRPNPFHDIVKVAQRREQARERNLARLGINQRAPIGRQHDDDGRQ